MPLPRSCLYDCVVLHDRKTPRRHRFAYRLFVFSLDLDEIPGLAGRLALFSHNSFNLFAFHDKDYLGDAASAKAKVISLAATKGYSGIERVTLVTHVRTAGHLFNPVSFYFCENSAGEQVCALAEVTNTFHERKLFWLSPPPGDAPYRDRQAKHFYISPFIALDAELDFYLPVPGDTLNLHVNDREPASGKLFFHSSLRGKRIPLTNRSLLWAALRFPFVTLGIVAGIHWQALRLWWKKTPWIPKSARPELQRDLFSRPPAG